MTNEQLTVIFEWYEVITSANMGHWPVVQLVLLRSWKSRGIPLITPLIFTTGRGSPALSGVFQIYPSFENWSIGCKWTSSAFISPKEGFSSNLHSITALRLPPSNTTQCPTTTSFKPVPKSYGLYPKIHSGEQKYNQDLPHQSVQYQPPRWLRQVQTSYRLP